MRLAVKDVAVKTAVVEIRALTVSGRQVTQAVFRQLPEEQLITYEGAFVGLPWGTVNYHPDKKACPSEDHRHVVWQLEDELRHAVVCKPGSWEPYYSGATDAFLLANSKPDGAWIDVPSWFKRVSTCDEPGYRFRLAGITCEANLPTQNDIQRLPEYIRNRQGIFDELILELREEDRRRADLKARWQEVCALPQLFIAV